MGLQLVGQSARHIHVLLRKRILECRSEERVEILNGGGSGNVTVIASALSPQGACSTMYYMRGRVPQEPQATLGIEMNR